jgi:hypothetical protein
MGRGGGFHTKVIHTKVTLVRASSLSSALQGELLNLKRKPRTLGNRAASSRACKRACACTRTHTC